MTAYLDPGFLERLLRGDLAALADPAQVEEVGMEELAYTALERAGLLRRVGAIPEDLAQSLADKRTVSAALKFLQDLALEDRLEAYLARSGEADHDADAGQPIESAEHTDEAETLFLHRDRVQAALAETARNLPKTRAARAALARVIARLARVDERWHENIHEFFVVLPLITRLKERFDWRKLDREHYWWWFDIEDAFQRVESGSETLEQISREALEEDSCTQALDDVGWLRAAYATRASFKGRRRFEGHLQQCPPCRRAIRELHALLEPAEAAGSLRLAAAATGEEALETLRARVARLPEPIHGTPFSVARTLKEPHLLRFTFHESGLSTTTHKLDGSEVVIDGIGRATVRNGAAEVALPRGMPAEEAVKEALAARRTLMLSAESAEVHQALGATLLAKLGRSPIPLP
jgi:hypothetical protein